MKQYLSESNILNYNLYHLPRYRKLIKTVRKYGNPESKILDIGNSEFSKLLNKVTGFNIDELGFNPDKSRHYGKLFQFDLNNAQNRNNWRLDMGRYDLIIFAEVIEHLYTSPALVLSYLKKLLNDGGIIIIQTPNAAALHKRIKLLIGKNPYMLISERTDNPAHFREYTKKELMKYARNLNFKVIDASYTNYFDYRYKGNNPNIKNKITGLLANIFFSINFPTFKPGINLVIKKQDIS